MSEEDEFIRLSEAADILKMSVSSVDRRIRRGLFTVFGGDQKQRKRVKLLRSEVLAYRAKLFNPKAEVGDEA